MEPRFGCDFSRVRVHADARAAEAASAIDARAFTLDRSIVFGAGEYAPQIKSGRRLLSHELTHVIQQGERRSVRPAPGVPLIVGDAHDRAEGEAERIADKLARGDVAGRLPSPVADPMIRRQPAETTNPKQASQGDDERLQALWDAVKVTKIGTTLLGLSPGEPMLRWGKTLAHLHGEFDGNKTIILNKSERDKLDDCGWKQVIAMELGNFASKKFAPIYQEAEQGMSEDDYVLKMEEAEFETRNLVIEACQSGDLCGPNAVCDIFTKVSFQEYITNEALQPHVEKLRGEWKEDFSWFYKKKMKAEKKEHKK